ncbi:class I SAM-dependent methyltransferase [Candidatus Uhrbacteria bacterium]|nr:class I SAM-dependent methyltransferase [Candidatus Uhrbacteria bacterium]
MTTFDPVMASSYDAMYAAKDYPREAEAYHELFQLADGPVRTVLSFGSGTLGHERFLIGKGYRFHGVDLSPTMVELAAERIRSEGIEGITVEQGDMTSYQAAPGSYDAVALFFNVVAYCDGLPDLERVIANAATALRSGGVLVFDAWNAAAVRKEPPHDRTATFEQDVVTITRATTATHVPEKHRVDLDITIDRTDGERTSERHAVHYWDIADIKRLLDAHGLELVRASRFPEISEPPSDAYWAIAIVARKRAA